MAWGQRLLLSFFSILCLSIVHTNTQTCVEMIHLLWIQPGCVWTCTVSKLLNLLFTHESFTWMGPDMLLATYALQVDQNISALGWDRNFWFANLESWGSCRCLECDCRHVPMAWDRIWCNLTHCIKEMICCQCCQCSINNGERGHAFYISPTALVVHAAREVYGGNGSPTLVEKKWKKRKKTKCMPRPLVSCINHSRNVHVKSSCTPKTYSKVIMHP